MADHKRNRWGPKADGAGSQEEGDRVKTKPVSCSTVGTAAKRTSQHLSSSDEEEGSADPPVPPKVSKIGFNLSGQIGKKSNNPISIKLGASKPKEPVSTVPPKKVGLASVFNEDDDSEPEEMPPEAKMRMKNIGRETPTSAGPNSFNKGKQGFSDNQKLWERKLKAHAEDEN
ncbi:PEST proteolytic signal-containing nuclear protein isoform X1 [Boleophthalmus pectinirostris]|uniref:PEST proteolytic signal-containing nuclear protein isoform X1 n=1 Tax=Boleophthalmus pectinirostris TaxID=150288 RepID=UPI000A1C366A|nr:PEST proteolytic signal-containing nuclear protein isoform X1 [Boleophthalmus pectinirostris]